MDIELCTYNSLRSVRIALFSVLQERFHSTVLKRVHGKPSVVMCTPVHYSLSMVSSLCTSISVVVLPIMRFVLLSILVHISEHRNVLKLNKIQTLEQLVLAIIIP